MAKQVPLDAPWTAKRARGVGRADGRARTSSTRASASGIGRDLFEMAVRGLFTGDLERRVVPPPAVPRARAREHQQPVLDREGLAGEPGRRRRRFDRADASPTSSATRCASSAPVRSITQRDDRVRRRRRRARRCRRAHAVVDGPARARARHRVRPGAPRRPARRCTATRSRGPETKTLVVYDEPFWRADGLQRPDRRARTRRPR